MTKHLKAVVFLLCALVATARLLCEAPLAVTRAQDKFPTGSFAAGMFTITFNSDGSHSVSADDKIVVKGTYNVEQDQLILTDKEGEYACDGPGKYKWKYDGKALALSKVEDECEGRMAALTGQPLVKK